MDKGYSTFYRIQETLQSSLKIALRSSVWSLSNLSWPPSKSRLRLDSLWIISAWTIRRIVGRPACVLSCVLTFTPEIKIGRVAWCKRMLRKRACFWGDVVSLDEVYFSIGANTRCRLVRWPCGNPRNQTKYTRKFGGSQRNSWSYAVSLEDG